MASLQMKELGVCVSFTQVADTRPLACNGPAQRRQTKDHTLEFTTQLEFIVVEAPSFLGSVQLGNHHSCHDKL
jgi:hypothetical protein